jgi:acetoin utilization deacetylase AcuC-like enzyme
MILLDPAADDKWLDYGILIPFPQSRQALILTELDDGAYTFPGPFINTQISFILLDKKVPEITPADVMLVHDPKYVASLFAGGDSLKKELFECYELVDNNGVYNRYDPSRAIKPLSELFFKTTLSRYQGSYMACRLALEDKSDFCFYMSGGNHHAQYAKSSGFCVLNDVVFAARKLQTERRVSLVWVIDVDAHKGDGTAEIVRLIRAGRTTAGFINGQDIITLSIHMAHGWPLDDATLAKTDKDQAPHIPCDVEIPVEAGEEPLYNEKLRVGLARLLGLSKGRAADIAIVIDGADPYEADELESSALLKLSLEQMLERDRLIYNYLSALSIPSAWFLAGGYGDKAWKPAANFLKSLYNDKQSAPQPQPQLKKEG